jgi:hypothetical protein
VGGPLPAQDARTGEADNGEDEATDRKDSEEAECVHSRASFPCKQRSPQSAEREDDAKHLAGTRDDLVGQEADTRIGSVIIPRGLVEIHAAT